MSTQSPIRVAIIGYGLAGAVFHAPLIASTPDMAITAIVTTNPDRIVQAQHDFPDARIYQSPTELWQSPEQFDLIVVASPNSVHVPLGIAAMQAGIPVVIDKPIAATVDEAQQLVSTSRETGVAFTIFQNRRWDGDFQTIRRLLAIDQLGTITRFESRFERYRPAIKTGAWREKSDPVEAGGLLYDLGSHLIDQAMQLFGRPHQVYAEQCQRRAEAAVDDDTFVALQFPSGVIAHLWMSAVTPILGPRFRVMGLRGGYEKYGLDPQEDALRNGAHPGDFHWGQDPQELWGTLAIQDGDAVKTSKLETVPGSYEHFYIGVRNAVLHRVEMPVDPAGVLDALHVIQTARQSAVLKRMMALDW